MSKIELAKQYSGRDLETIFFRPIMTGPDAQALGIRMMYNMPVPTTLNFWKQSGDILQKYSNAGWSGYGSAEKYQKTIDMQRVKAEVGYAAEDYFSLVFEQITNRAEVNMDDLSGTELEEAETALFKAAIAESIRLTMWLGDSSRDGAYATFDGFVKRFLDDIAEGETDLCTKVYDKISEPADAEKLLKELWEKAPAQLRGAKAQGELVYLATSDICAKYEEALDSAQLDSAYLARQNGREGLSFRGIPVIDLQLGDFLQDELPASFVVLTDRRNLAMAVNTADFPGTEVRMWYNPDEMQNRQRAIFMAGCDYLLPEMVSLGVCGAEAGYNRSAVTATGGAVSVTVNAQPMAIESVKACGLNASDLTAGAEVTLTRSGGTYSGTIAGTAITKVRFTVTYANGLTQVVVK